MQDKALFQLYYQDSNLDKQDQNLLCYHYTIVQCLAKETTALIGGCTTKIRTWTNRTRICCATITP